ncbi:MAG: hypothetical protein IKU60_05225 [Clostridia bacterium]|nr:hypothetical protein [Clostridia bacterium]
MNEPIMNAVTASTDPVEAAVLSVMIVLYALIIGLGLVQYIMTSISLYTIAKRRNIPNPILAWIPVADLWLIGQIADDYDEKTTGRKNWGKVMLTLTIVGIGLFVVFYVAIIAIVVGLALSGGLPGPGLIAVVVAAYLLVIVAALAFYAAAFLKYICTYKIYESTVPKKAVLYMVLSVMVPLAGGICLLKVRKLGCPEITGEKTEISEKGE